MSTAIDNERLYRRVIEEIWEDERLDVVDELVAEDVVYSSH